MQELSPVISTLSYNIKFATSALYRMPTHAEERSEEQHNIIVWLRRNASKDFDKMGKIKGKSDMKLFLSNQIDSRYVVGIWRNFLLHFIGSYARAQERYCQLCNATSEQYLANNARRYIWRNAQQNKQPPSSSTNMFTVLKHPTYTEFLMNGTQPFRF